MTTRVPAVVLVMLVVPAGCADAVPAAGSPDPATATVTRVVDGDTIEVRADGVVERVRLIGIDTPESVRPDTPVECFAKEATARASSLLPPGTPVVLVRDVQVRDRYDRLLAYVHRGDDGLFVNLDLVATGHAEAYEYPPNTAHSPSFAAAERTARAAGAGLWGACASG